MTHPAVPKSLPKVRIALLLTVLVAACGGGGSGTPVVQDPTDLDRAPSLYGIETAGIGGDGNGDGGAAGDAGDGSPLKRAVVTLTDAKGSQVRGTTDSRGKFLLKYRTSDFTGPLVLRVTSASGNILASVTDESAVRGGVVRVNVNPLTDKIASDAISSAVSGTDKAFNGSSVSPSRLGQAKADLVASVRAALVAAGVANVAAFDAVKSVYSHDGTGVDLVVESIRHSRDPVSGATQLRPKLAGLQTNPDGSSGGSLITATTPLPVELVALPSSPTLGFAKLAAWVNEINRCLAMQISQRLLDIECTDADGSRLISRAYRHDSADLREDLPSLDLSRAAQGAVVSNPLVLFTTRYPDSSAGYDDMAVVEVTVSSAAGGTTGESVQTLVFKRDDTLTRAKAGNWILYGNQNRFSWQVAPVYFKHRQINPQPVAGAVPSKVESCIDFNLRNQVFDSNSRSWRAAGLRAARITGPGLPAPGLVFTSGSDVDYLGINNKTGSIPTATGATTGPVTFFLASSTLDGTPLPDLHVSTTVDRASPMVTDFSPLQAYARYRIEVFLAGNVTGSPDAVEYVYDLAPVAAPRAITSMLDNDLSPSAPLVTVPSGGGESLTVQWTNNVIARPVGNVQVYSTQRDARGTAFGFGQGPVPALSSNGTRPSSQVVKASVGTINGVAQPVGSFPALVDAGRDSRRINIRTETARGAHITNWIHWN